MILLLFIFHWRYFSLFCILSVLPSASASKFDVISSQPVPLPTDLSVCVWDNTHTTISCQVFLNDVQVIFKLRYLHILTTRDSKWSKDMKKQPINLTSFVYKPNHKQIQVLKLTKLHFNIPIFFLANFELQK